MKRDRLIVEVPVWPRVANYLNGLLDFANGEADINARDIGFIIYNLVDTGLGIPIQKPHPGPVVRFRLPVKDELGKTFDGQSFGITISETNAARFNRFVDFMMRKELFDRLDLIVQRGENKRKSGKLKQEVEDFLERYQIDPQELSYDTLIKDYQRRRKLDKRYAGRMF